MGDQGLYFGGHSGSHGQCFCGFTGAYEVSSSHKAVHNKAMINCPF